MSDVIEVKVGQVWEDWDIRHRESPGRRRIKILEIKDGKAIVQHPSGQGTKTRIRLDRLKPTSTGYKLIEDVPAAAAGA